MEITAMRIVVLNGSPKGHISVTMQYVHFIQNTFPQHEFRILNISQRLKAIEKDEKAFQEIIDEIKSADGILWAFPLYYLLVHSHYKRFIELISERDAGDAFRNKYAAALSTSIHFYDHTAHNYINAVCDDLDMKYVGSFSADMYDLLEERERRHLVLFAEHFFAAAENNIPTSKSFQPMTHSTFAYVPGNAQDRVDTHGKKVVILTDAEDDLSNCARMVERFSSEFSGVVEVINLNDVDIKGGCLGCIQCGYDNHCVYEGKDAYVGFYNKKVKTADILVWAGTITDRYLSSRWKTFLDRSFFHGHSPSLVGKQIGFIISGPLKQLPNLRQVLDAYVQMQHANLVCFVTDESGDSAQITSLLQDFGERLVRCADTGYVSPPTFLGLGGAKVFRDDIWGRLRFPFLADHKVYKRLGMYDFPQKDYKSRITVRMMLLLAKIPSMRKEIYTKRMRAGMIRPLQRILEAQ